MKLDEKALEAAWDTLPKGSTLISRKAFRCAIRAYLSALPSSPVSELVDIHPSRTTKIWFDTEFIEDGKAIDLLAIGLVREDGATYYAEPAEADRSRADAWVAANVLQNLTGPIKPRSVIAKEIVEFAGPSPEFWAYYADYDWVALCQLFGRMIDLPDGWPMFCRDLQQVRASSGVELPEQKSVEHNALTDALWTKEAWEFLYQSSSASTLTTRNAELEAENARLRENREYWKKTAHEWSRRALDAEDLLAEAIKALDGIETHARLAPIHTSQVTAGQLMSSKLTMIREIASKAARRVREGGKVDG